MTTMKTPTLSEILHAADAAGPRANDTAPAAEAPATPEEGKDQPMNDSPQTQAVAAALAQTNPPIAPVYTGHTQSLYGELSAKAGTLQVLIEELVAKTDQIDLDAEEAIAAIKRKRVLDIAQVEAERANAFKAWTVLSETASKLKS